MTMIFAILIVLGFFLRLLEALPRVAIDAWPSRLCFLVAALLWAWPIIRGAG